MDRQYQHLNGEERGVILAEHRRGALSPVRKVFSVFGLNTLIHKVTPKM